MNKNKLVFIIPAIFLAIVLLINPFGKETNEIPSNNLSGKYTVTIINGNPDGGLATIAYKENDSYIDTDVTVYSVDAGTKVKLYFKDGLKEGYHLYCWAHQQNGIINIIKEADGETIYIEEKFIKTINEDLTLYVYPIKDDEHVISIYDSSLIERGNLIGLAIANKDGIANLSHVSVTSKDGFNFEKWSINPNKVFDDCTCYPVFNSNVYTVFRDYYPLFFKGLLVTLILSVVSVFFALFLGAIICLMRLSNLTILKVIATAYVEIIRGVPLLLQLLLVYCLLGPTKISFGSFFTTEAISCILALFINSSAYSSEIFRSGIQAVDKGQMEAGRALGLSKWQVMKSIIMPQGIRNSLPSIVNELVSMVKETSLAVSVDASIGELMSVRKNITAATYINLPPYIIVAMIYFCVTFTLSKSVGLIEKRLQQRD